MINNKNENRLNRVLAKVYGGENPLSEKAEKRLQKIRLRANSTKTIESFSNFIEFHKQFSSNTPIMDSNGKKVSGGGYFLVINGKGFVIDPGHHFLINYFNKKRTIKDIDAIFVTHFHDDHYADLPSLLSLLYRRSKLETNMSIDLFLDSVTLKMFSPIIKSSDYIHKPLNSLSINKKFKLNNEDELIIECLPTDHDVYGKRNTGFGFHFHKIKEDISLIITGDTTWTEKIEKFYYKKFNDSKSYKILVAHLSTIYEDEGAFIGAYKTGKEPGWHPNHLAIGGLCRCIAACKPNEVVLSEIGEELEEIVERIGEIISEIYHVKVSVGTLGKTIFLNRNRINID